MSEPKDLAANLLQSDSTLQSFKRDPKPVLEDHGITLSDQQQTNLKKQLDKHDLPTLKLMLASPALHTMVITQ